MPCDEILTAEELAQRWKVSERWIMDRTRDKDDPLPHVPLGRVKVFEWWSCPDSPLRAWWNRHRCCDDQNAQKKELGKQAAKAGAK